MSDGQATRRALRLLRALLYWLAVLVVSAVLVVLLILWLESRDEAEVESQRGAAVAALTRTPV